MRAALAPKIFFDFREIVEVVEGLHGGTDCRGGRRVLRRVGKNTVCRSGGHGRYPFARFKDFNSAPTWLRSQMMRRPVRVRNSSMVSIWREAPPMSAAWP